MLMAEKDICSLFRFLFFVFAVAFIPLEADKEHSMKRYDYEKLNIHVTRIHAI